MIYAIALGILMIIFIAAAIAIYKAGRNMDE